MAGEYGIAMGINQGLEKVGQAFDKRTELQMIAQQQEQQRRISNINLSNAEEQNKILKDKVLQMEQNNAKVAAYGAFDSFEATGDTKYLNLAIKDNPLLKNAMTQSGYTSVQNIKDFSPEKLAQLGYKEEEFVRPVVFNKADGTQQIGDLFTEYGKFGYLERAQDNLIKDYKTKVEGLRLQQEVNKTAISGTETENYLAYVEDMIGKGQVPLSMKEFGKPPKTSSDGSDIKTQTQAVVKLAELDTKPESELTPLELSQKKYFKALATTEGDEKRKTLNETLNITSKYLDGLSDKQVSLDEVKTVTAGEALTGDHGDKATVKTLTDEYVTLKQGYKLVDSVNKLDNEELNRGIADTGFQEMFKIFSDKSFDSMKPEEKAKVLQTVKFNTRLGSYLADYIKSMSGTAASDAEFARLKDVLTGGQFSNIQTLKSAISEFVTVGDEKFKTSLDSKYPLAKGSILNLKYNYDKELSGKLTKPQSTTVTKQFTPDEIEAELKRRGLK